MTHLQCPTRIHVARHGEAEYESDFVTDDGGSLTALGRQQARDLAEGLRGARIVRIWSSPLSRAVQTAEIVAGVLEVAVVVREGLREYAVGAMAGTSADESTYGAEVFRAWLEGDGDAAIEGGDRIDVIRGRVVSVLEEAADQHRGEAILVVTHGGAMLAALPPLVGVPAETVFAQALANCAVVELEADGDGWRAISWCGRSVRPGPR